MELIRDSITKELPPLRLYIDEITEVYSLLCSCCKEPIVIETCGYSLKTLEELSHLPKNETNRFHFRCRAPLCGDIDVWIRPCYGQISIQHNSLVAEGIASRIEDILLRGRVFVLFSAEGTWMPIIMGILTSVLIGASIISKNPFIVMLLFVFLCIQAREFFLMAHYNTIIFLTRKNSPNFWKRNKDRIIVGCICATGGAITLKIVEAIIKHIHANR